MKNDTVKTDTQLVAEYDQANSTIFKYWKELDQIEVKRIQSVVVPSLEAKGDVVAAALLKWAVVTMQVRVIEEKNRVEDD